MIPEPSRSGAEFGTPRRHFRLADSTNARARELAGAGAPHGTVVTATAQSAGRGRHGRAWVAPPGKSLLCSAILRPLHEARSLLPLAVPLAVAEAAEELAPLEAQVKWPNDVWIEGRKVAGVLIEARPEAAGSAGGWAVIGVGLNLTIEPQELPEELRDTATSLGAGTVEAALAALCERLDRWTTAEAGEVLDAYRRRDALQGRPIGWEGAGGASGPGTGTATGIADDGNLLVQTASGEELSLGAGEVHLSVS